MKSIKPHRIKDGDIIVPGSKSLTHRLIIAAALSDGPCTIENPLLSEDTRLTMHALSQMGIAIEETDSLVKVGGGGGRFSGCPYPIFLGNSGTSMRLLAAVTALGTGPYLLTGTERMHQRPIKDLLNAMNQAGIGARSMAESGCPPIEIRGGGPMGGPVTVDCTTSSQFLSALLLIGPCTSKGLEVTVSGGPVSRPYVDLTVDVMEKCGIQVRREGYERFSIPGDQTYRSGDYRVEADCSQAGYFWAAAAITGARIRVRGAVADSKQGDVRFARVLEEMGCRAESEADGVVVTGGPLSAVTVDMADMPDVVPTLAVVAAFARGTTVITNVAHLRGKESDRLATVAEGLQKMGIQTEVTGDGLRVTGGNPKGADIDTYDDHRIAMSFAVAGLRVPGVVIEGEMCVAKSFPNFWEVFEGLYHP